MKSCYFFRSYEAEVAYLNASTEVPSRSGARVAVGIQNIWRKSRQSNKTICRANCPTCSKDSKLINYADNRWCRSKGRYLSVGAAIISCRNGRAPDGLVSDAHLADGFLDLVLIKDCPRAHYLWYGFVDNASSFLCFSLCRVTLCNMLICYLHLQAFNSACKKRRRSSEF